MENSRQNIFIARNLLFGSALVLLTICAAGCISNEKTTYRTEPRMKVDFENDTAGRLFYETLNKMPESRNHTESSTEVSIPVVFDHKEKVVTDGSVAFNDAVRRCDTNGDGRITELEARIFAEQATKHQ